MNTEPAKVLLIGALIICVSFLDAHPQTMDIEKAGVVVARTLAGHVDLALTKVPAKGITVDLCTPHWQAVTASIQTDENGHFSFGRRNRGKLFYLRFSAPGVNTYKMRVRIDSRGPHELKIHLAVAT
jgi:hypothetical protein